MYSKKVQAYKARIKQKITDDEFERMFGANMADLTLHIVCMFLHTHAAGHCSATTALIAAGTNIFKNIGPEFEFFTVNKNVPDEVKVYPNLILASSAIGSLEYITTITPLTNTEAIAPMQKILEQDRKDGAKRKKWQSPIRSLHTLDKYITMSWAQFLRRVIKVDYQDDVVRDLSAAITAILQPVVINITTDPARIQEAYETGPSSCMRSDSGSATAWAATFKAEGLHPSSFYPYVVDIAFAYITNPKGKCVARTLVFDDCENPGKKTHFGRVYAATEEYQKRLVAGLSQLGITQQLGDDVYKLRTPFRVPGKWSATHKDFLCPIPYTDNIFNALCVRFDIPSKTFVFSSNYDNKATGYKFSLLANEGFLKAKDVVNKAGCAVCGKRTGGRGSVICKDGSQFCSTGHAHALGYIVVREADGGEAYVLRNPSLQVTTVFSGQVFASKYAAMKKCIPVYLGPRSPTPVSEDCVDLPSAGVIARYKGLKTEFHGIKVLIEASLASTLSEGRANASVELRRESDGRINYALYELELPDIEEISW